MIQRTGILTDVATSELLKLTGQGDRAAFEELCGAVHKSLLAVAVKLVGDADTARDVLQDAFVVIWEGAKNFRGGCKPFSWMCAVVKYKAMDALRARRRYVTSGPGQIG